MSFDANKNFRFIVEQGNDLFEEGIHKVMFRYERFDRNPSNVRMGILQKSSQLLNSSGIVHANSAQRRDGATSQ